MRSSMTPLEYTLQLHGQRRVLKKGHKHTHRHSSGIGIGTRIGISKPAHHLCSHFSAKQMSHSEEHGLGALSSSDEVQARLLWIVTEGAFRRHRKSFSPAPKIFFSVDAPCRLSDGCRRIEGHPQLPEKLQPAVLSMNAH